MEPEVCIYRKDETGNVRCRTYRKCDVEYCDDYIFRCIGIILIVIALMSTALCQIKASFLLLVTLPLVMLSLAMFKVQGFIFDRDWKVLCEKASSDRNKLLEQEFLEQTALKKKRLDVLRKRSFKELTLDEIEEYKKLKTELF